VGVQAAVSSEYVSHIPLKRVTSIACCGFTYIFVGMLTETDCGILVSVRQCDFPHGEGEHETSKGLSLGIKL
jgi:hypothetical protein